MAFTLDLKPSGATVSRATTGQEYFFYMEQIDPDPRSVNMVFALELVGPLDPKLLARALAEFFARRSSFRTAYREIDGKLHQHLVDRVVEVTHLDRTDVPASEWDARCAKDVEDLLVERLDAAAGETARARIVRFSDERHALLLSIHHIVFDMNTWRLLPVQIFEAYRAIANKAPVPEPAVQMVDYTQALQAWAQSPAGKSARAYWTSQLEGIGAIELPLDHPRDAVDAERGAKPLGITASPIHTELLPLSLETYTALEQKVAGWASAESLFLAAQAWLLHRHTKQPRICIETTYEPNETIPALQDAMGLIETWSVVAFDFSKQPSFRDVVAETERRLTAFGEHGVIVDYYRLLPHSLRRVSFQSFGAPAALAGDGFEVVPGLRARQQLPARPAWKRPWDFHISHIPRPDKSAAVVIGGNARLFEPATIQRLGQEYIEVVTSL